MVEQIVLKIQSKFDILTPSEKKVANHIMSNPTSIALSTSSQLAKEIGVSESTVIRFATQLDYTGYSDLKRSLQDDMREDRTLIKLRNSIVESNLEGSIFSKVMHMDMENIRLSLKDIKVEDLEKVAQVICSANRVFTLGKKGSTVITNHLEFYLQILLDSVVSLSNSPTWHEEMAKATSKDCLIAVSFKRYSKETIEGIKHFKEIGGKTIAITDSNNSPVSKYADITLKVRTSSVSFVDSYTAAISLTNAIMTYIAKKNKSKVEEKLQKLETLYKKSSIFY